MKYLIVLIVFLLSATMINAKDVTIKIQNPNNIPVVPYVGLISAKDNEKSDDEIIQNKDALQIKNAGRALKPDKKTQVKKYDISTKMIIVVFGLYTGGGRTDVYRYKVRDLKGDIAVTFKEYTIYKPEPNYLFIAKMLDTLKCLGIYYQGSAGQSAGTFLFANLNAPEISKTILKAVPKTEMDFKKSKPVKTSVGDLIYKTATLPVRDLSGKILMKPEKSQETYRDIYIPGLEKPEKLFGSNEFQFLTWYIVNSENIAVNLEGESFLNLFNFCDIREKSAIIDKFNKTIHPADTTEFHLFFLTSLSFTDTVRITGSDVRAIEPNELLEDYDVTTASGNFRFTGDETPLYTITNIFSNVVAVDITPLLYYIYIRDTKFPNTMDAAVNCLEAYKKLSGVVDLAVLDDDAMGISKPAYTISKVKEAVATQKVLEAIEAKCASSEGPLVDLR